MIIKNRLQSNLILSIGGIISILIGVYHLSLPGEIDKGGIQNWMLGIIFLTFGLIIICKLLDFMYLKIGKDELEIKSLFRNRIIPKDEIIEYGIENYEGKHVAGERIRLFCNNGSYKFHTSQLESIEEIKEFVKGKKIKENAFAREKIGSLIAIPFCILLIISPILYDKYISTGKEELQAIGIPVTFKNDIRIIEEKGNNIKFELKEYQNYIFTVDKDKTPKDLRTTKKELIIFIDEKEYAQELSKMKLQNLKPKNTKIIPVDEIVILE